VGITTLEEVFLKIAEHPEEEEPKHLSISQGDTNEKAPLIDDPEIESYSIMDQREQGAFSTFLLSLRSLLRKKFFLQIRDQRTLIIEMLFPIIFIFVGLFLATIKPIKEGSPRYLSPEIMPTPSHLVYNDKIPHPTMLDTKSEMISSEFSESFWDMKQPVNIDFSKGDTNYTDMLV
jgi:hypothetical protein